MSVLRRNKEKEKLRRSAGTSPVKGVQGDTEAVAWERSDLRRCCREDGIRLSWNLWPHAPLTQSRLILPLGFLYTPMKLCENLKMLNYYPLECSSGVWKGRAEVGPADVVSPPCRAIFNPYCSVNLIKAPRRKYTWTCNFCGHVNQFPPMYAHSMTQTSDVPLEKKHTTIEYLYPNKKVPGPSFLLVIDVTSALTGDVEFERMHEAVTHLVGQIPSSCHVGIISYHSVVYVHEMGGELDVLRTYAFHGEKLHSTQRVAKCLDIIPRGEEFLVNAYSGRSTGGGAGDPAAYGLRTETERLAHRQRFLVSTHECAYRLNSVLEDLQKMSGCAQARKRHQRMNGIRAERATGAALGIAVALMENLYISRGGRIILVTSGPCTIGPGTVVDTREKIRTSKDVRKKKYEARYAEPAAGYYNSLGARALTAGHAIDIFACCTEEPGLSEMRFATDRTGGVIVMADSFGSHVFRDSLMRLLARPDDSGYFNLGLGAKITMVTRDCYVTGCLGNASPHGLDVEVGGASRAPETKPETGFAKKGQGKGGGDAKTGDGEIPEATQKGRSVWRCPGLEIGTTIAWYVNVINAATDAKAGAKRPPFFIQIQTLYDHPSGSKRLRVTTIARPQAERNLANVEAGFDAGAATVLLTRRVLYEIENSFSPTQVLKHLDGTLASLAKNFGAYNKNMPHTFSIGKDFRVFLDLMYYLRRSPLIDSPSLDETALYRHSFSRESVDNCMLMLQPALLEYSMESVEDGEGARPIALDHNAISSQRSRDKILFMDTFFYIVIWRGSDVQNWFDEGAYDEYVNRKRKDLLQAPVHDAKRILATRFPVAKFVQTFQGGSQARFLQSKLEWSEAKTGDSRNGLDLQGFMDRLIQYAVRS